MSDWFSSLAAQAIQFADNLADSLVTQAAEAQHQIEIEQNKIKTEDFPKEADSYCTTILPWETTDESQAILSQELMEQILNLSVHENNFCTTAANSNDVHFSFRVFVPTAMRLLQLDSNLARSHSKLSPKMDEEVFWFNYYCRIVYLRQMSGIDGTQARLIASQYNTADVVSSDDNMPINAMRTNMPNGPLFNGSDGGADNAMMKLHSGSTEPVGGSAPAAVAAVRASEEVEEEEEELDLDCLGDLDELDLLDLGDLDDEEEEDDHEHPAGDARNLQKGCTAPSIETASSTVTDFEKVRAEDCGPSSTSDSGDADSDAELEAQIARELAAEE